MGYVQTYVNAMASSVKVVKQSSCCAAVTCDCGAGWLILTGGGASSFNGQGYAEACAVDVYNGRMSCTSGGANPMAIPFININTQSWTTGVGDPVACIVECYRQ
jgi:hypothetical protein